MKELKVFEFQGTIFKPVPGKDGDPWFVAKELCEFLGVKNVSQALSRLDDDERDAIILNDTVGREQEMLVVSESGLYELVMRSRKKIGDDFRRWIRREVVPNIRKHGFYVDENRLDDLPDNIRAAYIEFKSLFGHEPRGGVTISPRGDVVERSGGMTVTELDEFRQMIKRQKRVV